MKRYLLTSLVLSFCSGLGLRSAQAAIIDIYPAKDNTLYQDDAGLFSNGSGEFMFVGATAFDNRRRAVMNFDIAGTIPSGATINSRRAVMNFDIAGTIPSGATINSVMLTLTMSRCGPTCTTTIPIEMHRLVTDWGEGASDAFGQEGIPANAEPGDATWLHSFYPGTLWANPGGDFTPVVSAVQNVTNLGVYNWSSAGLAADVQNMLDNPAGNYGWLMIGGEDNPVTAKRFNTRENASFATIPKLTIDWTPVPEPSTILFVAAGMLGIVRFRRRV